MNLLETLHLPHLEEIQTIFPLKFETLYDQPACEFFRGLDPFVNQLLTEHPAFSLWYDVLGEEKRDIIKSAVIDQDFSKIADDSPDYQTALQLLIFKNKLRHSIIKQYLAKTGETSELLAYERVTIEHYCDLGEVTDRVFLRWRNSLFHSELGKKIKAMEKEEEGKGAAYVKTEHLDNQYSIYEQQDGKWQQNPLAVAFPEEYQKKDMILAQLIDKLLKLPPEKEQSSLIAYFQALRNAFAGTTLQHLDALWEAVDRAWLGVTGRLQPVHAMEFNYVDPARVRVMPENRLMITDERFSDVNNNAQKTQKSLISDLKELFSTKRSWPNSEVAMSHSTIGVYIPIVFSGANLAFKFVGQSAPCREHVRIQCGSKISLNMQSCKDRFAKEMKYTEAVFGKESAQKFFSSLTPEENISLRIAGHEVAHAAFVDEHTTERIGSGVLPLLEEAKATWGEYATAHKRIERGELPASARATLALLMLCANMRYLTIKHETTLQPYYTAALMELNTMLETGFIEKSGEQMRVNMEKLDAFYAAMTDLYMTMVKIYDEYDSALARHLLEGKAQETPLIQEMYAKVSAVK